MRFCIVLLTLCCLLTACAKGAPTYADGIACSEILEEVQQAVPVEQGYETYGARHLTLYFEGYDDTDDFCLCYSAKTEDINEIGIFHTPVGKSVAETEEMCREYLEALWEEKQAFIAGYAPEELPKLKHAEVRSYGRYTVYAILDDADRARLFDAVEGMLKESVDEGGKDSARRGDCGVICFVGPSSSTVRVRK